MAEAGNLQDEPGASAGTESKEMLKKQTDNTKPQPHMYTTMGVREGNKATERNHLRKINK